MAYRYPVDAIDTLWADALASGESTMPRIAVSQTAVASGNGSMRFTYFTARKSETITQVRWPCAATAQVGASLCRIGVYSVNGSGDLTLVAATANDTNLWLAGSTSYTKSFASSFAKVRGTRYAMAALVVGTSTAPTFYGQTALIAGENGFAPVVASLLSGQTDLPSSVPVGSLTLGQSHRAYAALLP